MRKLGKMILVLLVGAIAIAGVRWGWRATRPREITVCAFSDYAFRNRPNWEESIVARFREANRVFRDVKVSWNLISSGTVDPTGQVGSIDQRRTALPKSANCTADIVLSFTGLQPGKRFGSVGAFSRSAIVVDQPDKSDAENARVLVHALAALFGAPVEAAGSGTVMTEPPESDRFSPKTAALIRNMRGYNFAAGIDGLTPEWSGRALKEIENAAQETKSKPIVRAHRAIAVALANELRMEAAVPHLREVLKLDPGNALAHAELASALVQLSKSPEALKEINEAVRLAPNDASLRAASAGVLARTGDTEAALDQLNRAIEMEPSNVLFRLSLGNALLKEAGRIDPAIAAFKEASRMAPNSQFVTSALQRAEGQKLKFEEDAVRQRQIAAQPAAGLTAQYGLGNAELWAGHLDAAIKAFDKSADMAKPNGRPYAALAVIRYLKTDYSGAWKEVKLARAGNFEPPAALIAALRRKQPE